jgi:thermosome
MQRGQPMIIMGDDAQRVKNKDAQQYNISAARGVAEAVRTTLGPKGMDKMLVDSNGSVTITNDGATILKEMDIDNPAANMIVEVAETQQTEIGDGTTSAVVIAGALLSQAEDLLEQGIHPTTIVHGYHQAAEKAKEILTETAIDVSKDDYDTLIDVVQTSMTGKGAENAKHRLAELVVNACLAVTDDDGINTNNISVQKVAGSPIEQSELIEGTVIDGERADENMPLTVGEADVALFGGSIEVKETEVGAEISVTDPNQLQQFLDREETQVREMVDHFVDIGADVVFVSGEINALAQHYLAQKGILAVHHVESDDLNHLARATGGRVISNLDDINSDALGFAGSVTQNDIDGDERITVADTKAANSVTLILRGGTEHIVNEVERAVNDSLGVVRTTITDTQVLAGGGAPEIELSLQLRDFAASIGGREQLAVEAFADALEAIPRTLAENAGLDPIDTIVELRAKHSSQSTIKTTERAVPVETIINHFEYYRTLYLHAELGGYSPTDIQNEVTAAVNKSSDQIRREVASVYHHLDHGHFKPDIQQTFREISNLKDHLADYHQLITESDDALEQLDEKLTSDEFYELVDSYVDDAVAIDTELEYDVDPVSKMFYRKKHELYLQHRYTVTFNTDQKPPDPLTSSQSQEYSSVFNQYPTETPVARGPHAGLDTASGAVTDTAAKGIIEPLQMKIEAIQSATEAATLSLRIDDIISVGDLKGGDNNENDPNNRPNGMDGMGGMGGMGGVM